MKFSELKVGDRFKRVASKLVWTKAEPFTAYGSLHGQNATSYSGGWHYDRVSDDETITKEE